MSRIRRNLLGFLISSSSAISQSMFSDPRSTKKAPPETEKGIPLAPAAKDLNPWYSDGASGKERETNEDRK